MANLLIQLGYKKPKRNAFDLSYESKLTTQMGRLTPIMCTPVVPGDKFRDRTEFMARLAPMIAPMMHQVNIFTHFFFVPNRLVWNEWEEFITRGVDGEDTPILPRFNPGERGLWESFPDLIGKSSLMDYFGIPHKNLGEDKGGVDYTNTAYISALPFRAYQLIYNEYYRDQNLTPEIEFSRDGGLIQNYTQLMNIMSLRNRCWEKDYFTSALPWQQRGPDVYVGEARGFEQLDVQLRMGAGETPLRQRILTNQGNNVVTGANMEVGTKADKVGNWQRNEFWSDLSGNKLLTALDPNGTMYVDLEEGIRISINDLRTSQSLQRWFEKMPVAVVVILNRYLLILVLNPRMLGYNALNF